MHQRDNPPPIGRDVSEMGNRKSGNDVGRLGERDEHA